MARRTSEQKLEREGFKFHGYEYESGARSETAKLERSGYETRLLRERSDTAGMKMYSVWKREA